MQEKTYQTAHGTIHYWVDIPDPSRQTLVFLPGLTADHRLFEKQLAAFAGRYNRLTWDAPGHAASRPFVLDFALKDKAIWLHDILEREGVSRPVLIGQSMGGYVSQCFMELYPGSAEAFVSIDSAPLKRHYYTGWELWLLKRCEPIYRYYPWKPLQNTGAKGCAVSAYGQALMRAMMNDYTHEEYSRLAGHGFAMLAEAVEAKLPYRIDCPCLLLCGEKDRAGSARSYNRRWAAQEDLELVWIKDAGHNSNTDAPERVNALIENFLAVHAAVCR